MPRFVIIATCQTQSLALLARQMMPDSSVFAVDFTDPAAYTAEGLQLFEAESSKADFVLAQFGGFGPYAFDALRAAFPKRFHSLATIYFRGLHPDACYVGLPEDKLQDPSLYHSLVLLDAFKQGKPESWAATQAFTYDNFERLGLFDAWEASLDKIRELDAKVDFPIARHIEAFCLERPGFFTFNHPSLPFLHDYLFSIFTWLGFTPKPANLAAIQDPLEQHDMLPIHDFVAERFHLPYRTTQHWKLAHLNLFADRAEIVRRFYEAYRKADFEKLLIRSPGDLRKALQNDPARAFLAPKEATKD